MAPRLSANLLKDKVYGFHFTGSEIPLFSPPGHELGEVFERAIEAAIFTDMFQIFDVKDFSRKATFDRLEQILQRAGARVDETAFIRQVIAPSDPSLPSIDDAFAFIYNFYLEPVDRTLAEQKINFFRYRDEYFVFDHKTRKTVEQELEALGLSSRPVAEFTDLYDKKFDLNEEVSPEEMYQEFVFGRHRGGELIAKYECDTWSAEEKRCVSETYELTYSLPDLDAVAELFKLPPKPDAFDGVNILPLLRAIHKQRRLGALLQPPFNNAPTEFAEYRRRLSKGRAWLFEALATGVDTGADWQIVWTSRLISDLGPLKDQEVKLLQKILKQKNSGDIAKSEARLALARSSSVNAASFWSDPKFVSEGYHTRASILGASHLARRGNPQPWNKLDQRTKKAQPHLSNLLSSYVSEANR